MNFSYTTFNIDDAQIKSSDDEGNVELSCKVTNTGDIKGREVVQIYVHDEESRLARPYKELKAFGKTKDLNSKQSEVLSFKLNKRSFSYFDDFKHKWVLEPGAFQILVSTSSSQADVHAILNYEVTKGLEYI